MNTTLVCKPNLYVETFTVIATGGAVGGSMETDYLTDSINFRMYVGTYDEADGGYSYKCEGDSIKVYEIVGRSTNQNKVVSIKGYNHLDLKKNKKFD